MRYVPQQYSETSFLHRWLPRLIWTLINAQCEEAIKTHQAWTGLNKKHTVQNRVKEKKNWEQRAQGDRKTVKTMHVWVCVCDLGTRTRGRLTAAYASSYTTTCGQSSVSWCRPVLCNSSCSVLLKDEEKRIHTNPFNDSFDGPRIGVDWGWDCNTPIQFPTLKKWPANCDFSEFKCFPLLELQLAQLWKYVDIKNLLNPAWDVWQLSLLGGDYSALLKSNTSVLTFTVDASYSNSIDIANSN